MKKLIQGIVDFRQKVQKEYRESFGRLATGQSPDTLFIACSDSRVVPNTFASTNPGDLFVLRNVGNLIPRCTATHSHALHESDSEAAAIEFSVLNLQVSHIVICGHSECGAMNALTQDRSKLATPNLKSWLRHGDESVTQHKAGRVLDPSLSATNQLSQLNVLMQIENVKSYPTVQKRIDAGTLSVHGWWFDIANADVYAYEVELNRFVLIDEIEAERIFKQM